MTFRQISAVERTASMFPLQSYAFVSSPWPEGDQEAYGERMKFFETALNWVAEENGETLACAAALRMRQNVRGTVHDMAGVASVASHPSARRRGLVRGVIERLLGQARDEGHTVSALYPFRPSFYARFGYVGTPRHRIATFAPEGLSHLNRAELPGEVERLPMRDGFAEWQGLQRRLVETRHGFAVYDETRAAEFRDDKRWVAIARVDGEVVGALSYQVKAYGGELVGSDLLTTGPLGRALLLQFLSRHVDQVARVRVRVGTDDVPELWGTDFAVTTEGRVDFPTHGGAMVRVLDMPGLSGTAVGDGDVTIEIPDDTLVGGSWRLVGEGGRLTVTKGTAEPAATLSVGGFSGLLYGVLDPIEVITRGLGRVDGAAVGVLSSMFPREMPYICADF
ncbi:GNAT family N-acetyltransferase [Actinoplanes sp. LDG1-06]|uniref:GNAT family N-acetyltransferase n=1 Tax=Paractinoplanes ovalisporus TaxID=2810368 RepID=A0ABS2APZ5_9ACTN|nr:GNAT family N-acetyltransferase [Actinoplanes ovalisporus]MBM2621850.1 GNAT family N-acetyltransferase [Actinoplanes ovalisporus]